MNLPSVVLGQKTEEFPLESSSFSLLNIPLMRGLEMISSYASRMRFVDFVDDEMWALKNTFSAFARHLQIDPKKFHKTFAKTADYAFFMMSRKPVIMRFSQQSEIMPEENGSFSLGRFDGGFLSFTMGPAFAKHGFGFLRVEANDRGYIFPTLALPDQIADSINRYDKDGKFLSAMVQAFSIVDHDWAHQLTPRVITSKVTGALNRPAPMFNPGNGLGRSNFRDHFNASVKMEEGQYYAGEYEIWAGSAHALAVHKLWNDGERAGMCNIIDDYFLQLKEMQNSIMTEKDKDAEAFYHFGFDFLAFNFTRAFSKNSPLVKYVFEKNENFEGREQRIEHAAIQLFMSYHDIRVRNGKLDIPLDVLGRANYKRLADTLIDIYSRSGQTEDQLVSKRLLQIREQMNTILMNPIYDQVNILGYERNPFLTPDQSDFEKAFDGLVSDLCLNPSSRYGSLARALRDLHAASSASFYGSSLYDQHIDPVSQGLVGETVTPVQFMEAKTQLYWNIFASRSDSHTCFLKEKDAVNLSRLMVQDAEKFNTAIEKYLKKQIVPSAPCPE